PTHTHGESEIIVTVFAGEGEAAIDGKVEMLRPGIVLRCEGHEAFGVRNTGQGPLSLMVVLAPGNPKFAGNVR
ncbi:MAG: cupin domain-containing protein, partial [Bacteroidales bacterium]